MKAEKEVKLPSRKRMNDDDVEDFGNKAETEVQKEEKAAPKKKTVTRSRKPKPKPTAAKVKRDSFTMPEDDYLLIQRTINRLMKSGVLLNKGEVLRAGLHALNAMPVKELKAVAEGVERVKTGRPPE